MNKWKLNLKDARFLISKELKMIIRMLRKNQVRGEIPSVEQTREYLEKLTAMLQLPKDVKCESFDVNGLPVEWITAPGVETHRVILYLHGGGYICGSIKTHREFVARLSREARTRAFLIDYRLAPENPFPAALDDAVKSYKWLVSEGGIEPKNVVIAGESAGGGLTLATLMKLRDIGEPIPAAGICLSPWTDLAVTGESVRTKADIDPFITPEVLHFYSKLYGKGQDSRNPYISPLYGDFRDLPPILIQVGTSEVILDDSTRMAERARAAGMDVTLEVWDEMIHAWQLFAALIPEGRKAITRIAEFIQEIFERKS
ncbi:MAG: alpha/beta hydrolase [Candidatus Helarchaeota archaeon]